MISFLKTFAPLAWRNLWRNARRTVITLIVVSVGLWSVLIFNAFLNAWSESGKQTTLSVLIGEAQIHAPGYMDDPNIELLMPPPDPALRAALDDPAISHWASRLIVPGVVQSEYKTLPVSILGVDPKDEMIVSSLPAQVVEGRYLASETDAGVVLGESLAERLETGLGRRVILMSQNTSGALSEQSFDVVGIFDSDKGTEDFYAFTGRKAAQDFLGLKDEIAEIVLRIPDEKLLDQTVATVQKAAPDLEVKSWHSLSLMLAASDTFMKSFVFVWLGVVFSIMAIGIVNTQLMAVFERTHEIGLLRALGMKPRQVLWMITLESAFMVGLGVLLGLALGALSIFATYDGIDLSAFSEGMEMIQAADILYPDYDLKGFAIFSGIIWILGILVAIWPARRAARLSPVEAMRYAS